MISINNIKKRNKNSSTYNDDNSIYNQYILDYQYYFEHALNKTQYIGCYDTTINGKCIILDVSINNQYKGDEKYLTTLPNSQLKIGDTLNLTFQNNISQWILTEKEDLAIPSHEKFKVRPCNHTFKWLKNGCLYEQKGIASNNTKYTPGTKAEAVGFIEVDAMYGGRLPYNDITKTIEIGDRFIINKNAWKVSHADFTTEQGLLVITFDKDSINYEIDDVENEICGAFEHLYAITLSSNTQTLIETETYKIVPTITDKGVVISNATITYKSSDEAIATIDSNGLVNALKVGNCTITCSIGNTIASLVLTVTAKTVIPVISYSCDWSTGKTSNGVSLKTYMSSTANCKETIDGMVNSALVVNYSLDSVGNTLLSTGAISITRKSNVDFLVKNVSVSTSKSFVITFTNSADNSVISNQIVSLIGM